MTGTGMESVKWRLTTEVQDGYKVMWLEAQVLIHSPGGTIMKLLGHPESRREVRAVGFRYQTSAS